MYTLVPLAVTLALVQLSSQCATNGLCGMGPTCGAYAPPPPTCGGCRGGYSCGSYGCYRARAAGSRSYQPHRSRSSARTFAAPESSIEADRAVLNERLAETQGETPASELEAIAPSVAANQRSSGPVDPNKAFMDCCLDRQLPDACLQKCNFASFTKDALSAMYFKQDACPMAAMTELQFCAAQGRDHTECCARNGVTTTLAGSKCLTFCDQRIGKPTRLDMSYVPCFDRFESMKACFWHDLTRFSKV